MFLSFYTTRVQFRYHPRPMFRTSYNDHRSKSRKFITVSSWWRNFSNEYGMIWSRAYNWLSRKKNVGKNSLAGFHSRQDDLKSGDELSNNNNYLYAYTYAFGSNDCSNVIAFVFKTRNHTQSSLVRLCLALCLRLTFSSGGTTNHYSLVGIVIN